MSGSELIVSARRVTASGVSRTANLTEQSLKILFICNDLPYFIAHRLPLARYALEAGHQLVLASGMYDQAAAAALPADMRLEVLTIDKHHTAPVSDYRLMRKIGQLCVHHRPDLVHSITIKPNLAAALALSRIKDGPPLVMTFLGLGKVFEPGTGTVARHRRRIVTALFRYARARLDPVATTENPADAQALADLGIVAYERIHETLGAGIDFDHFTPATASGRPTVLFAGRLIRAKGIELFIEAARNLRQQFDARFLIAGPLESENPDRVSDAAIAAAQAFGIDYLGAVNPIEMPSLLQQVDIFCAPTLLREGLPRAVIEAMASGCAVVASAQPATRQIVDHGKTGFLLDRVEGDALTAQLAGMLVDIDATRQLGARAAAVIRRLPVDENAVHQVFDQAWRHALGEAKAPNDE